MSVITNLINRLAMSVFLIVVVTQTVIADPNLVGWWKLDEGTGTTARDSSGNQNHGTLYGNVEREAGKVDGALHFDGSSGHVRIPFGEILRVLNEGDVTFAAWFKADSVLTEKKVVFQQGDGVGTGRTWLYAEKGGEICSYLGNSTTGSGVIAEPETWYHGAVVVTEAGATDTIQVYVNGEAVTLPNPQDTESCEGPYFIGCHKNLTNFWEGIIDDVRIFNRVLSADDLAELWAVDPNYNYPPNVDAGDYRPIVWEGETVTVQLDASVYDADPTGDGVLRFQWSELCGPGSVEFFPSADIEDPCAVFAMPGIYTLLLQAWDEVPQEGNDVAIIRIKETRPGEVLADDIAAWERLKNLQIPGIDADPRFNITCTNTRYVSPTGSDSDAGTIDNPWRTLSKAASSMAANRVIYLREGAYYGPVEISFRGSLRRLAALRGYPGEHVIIQYPQSFIDENQAVDHYAPLFKITGSYIEVSNLHLIGARDQLPQSKYSENGIQIHGNQSECCRILYNEIENVGHCGVKGGRHSLTEGNYIHDVGQGVWDHGIYCWGDDATIRKNLITNSTGWGVHAYTAPARLEITHNILSGHAQDGIVLGGPDCRVLHNIFYHNTQGGIFFFRRHCRDNIIKNNIFDEPVGAFRHDSLGSPDPAEHPQNNLMDHNCLTQTTPDGDPSPYDTYGPNNFTADPRWVDPSKLDFRLMSNSACINAGEDLGFGSNCGPFYDHVQVTWPIEDFETGEFSIFDWTFSGYASWAVTSEERNSGKYSARAGSISDNESSALSIRLDCISGDISFYCKVSSEREFDLLEFYIDGLRQDKWSGIKDWFQVSFPVEEGARTFQWIYVKDSSISRDTDTAWIDDIVFPIN